MGIILLMWNRNHLTLKACSKTHGNQVFTYLAVKSSFFAVLIFMDLNIDIWVMQGLDWAWVAMSAQVILLVKSDLLVLI